MLDPVLTLGLPPYVTAITGMDALSHAVESFTNGTYCTKAENFIEWIEETNRKMGLPSGFDMIETKDIPRMIKWALKEANPLYPVPEIWNEKDFREIIESIR